MSRNQAEEIRQETVKLLKNVIGQEDNRISDRLYGIRYSTLKEKLLSTKKYTEGAVTGALNTITDRVELVGRVKHQNKSYYYYASSENKIEKNPVYITESEDFKSLYNSSISIQKNIEEILNKSSKEKYKEVSELDKKSLRYILQKVNELNESIRDYRHAKSFEIIEDNSNIELPF